MKQLCTLCQSHVHRESGIRPGPFLVSVFMGSWLLLLSSLVLAAALPLRCRVTEKGNYSEKDASELIRQVLEGVAYLHSQGKRLPLYVDSLHTEPYMPHRWM